jgi:hypothetical protein
MRRRASAKKKKQKKADDSDEYGDDQVIIQPKPPCFISLEDEPHEEAEVSTAANKREFKLVYPRNAPDSITITQSDIDRLEPGIHLNDNIIDFYLKYLKHHGLISSLQKRFYFFNTYFYTTLAKESGLERVKKWTKDIDIFLYDFLMIPIHDKEHWRLVIVCYPAECENYKPEGDEKSKSAMLLFDSLSWVDKKIYKTIRAYLSFEWENKRKKKLEFTAKSIPGIKPKVPIQDNNIDCGVYVLKYAEKFCTEPPDDLIENPPQYFKWFGADDILIKRQEVKNLLERLFAEERARLGWDTDDEKEDEEMNGKDEDNRENGHNNGDEKMDEDKVDKNGTKNSGEGDDGHEKIDEENSPKSRRSSVRSPAREPQHKLPEEADDDEHSGPTTDREDDSATKIRQLLRQRLHTRTKLKESGEIKPIQHSNDSPIINEVDTNDELENKVSLRSMLKKSLEEDSTNSNNDSNSTKNSNNNSGDENSSENASPRRRNGKSSPKKKLSRSKQHDKNNEEKKEEEEDTVMLGASDDNADSKLLVRDDSVVLLGASPSVRRSSRVLKKSSK